MIEPAATRSPLGPPPPVDGPVLPWAKRWKMRLLSVYPPYVGAGVRVDYLAPDFSCFDIKMVSRWWNRNYVGTHFGGSLYSMCDPFFMLILIERLGRDFLVWDKAATIRFRRPGKGTMWARFHLDAEEVERVRALALAEETVEPVYRTRVVDGAGKLVAEVEKVLWVSRKKRSERAVGVAGAGDDGATNETKAEVVD